MSPPPNPKDQPRQPVVNRQELQQYSGPIPPPVMLEQYNKIVPGAAERILKMAEEQASHRRNLEKQALSTDSRNSTFGIVCALLISAGVLFLAGYAIKLNQPIAASLISAVGIGSLVGTFIYGTCSRRIERDSRLK